MSDPPAGDWHSGDDLQPATDREFALVLKTKMATLASVAETLKQLASHPSIGKVNAATAFTVAANGLVEGIADAIGQRRRKAN
jgi:hypothetical protein